MGGLAAAAISGAHAQPPEPDLPRPGIVMVADVTGDVQATVGDTKRVLKVDDRIRVGSTIATGRKAMVTLILSNGASLQLGAESELEVEEFGQAAVSGSPKFSELKAEPTVSRTRLRLLRGDVIATVRPLQVSRGSSFWLSFPAGVVRAADGAFRAMVRMHDLGLGVCTLQLDAGSAELEVAGRSGGFQPIPAGKPLAFAIELEKNGTMKVGEMPKETPPAKK
jgi:ferric-dicitrate binding protein FerR (iron transport regulator)